MSVLGRAVVPSPDLRPAAFLVDADPACRAPDVDPEWFFPLGEGRHDYAKARAVCGRCPLLVPCAQWAADSNQRYGFWGGLGPEQVSALRQRRNLRKEQA